MANYETVDDLRLDALWRAGEPTDGSSNYATKVMEYLNAAQLGLLIGGPFGPGDERGMDLPVVDWWWARKRPYGVFNTEASRTTGTVTATQGSTTLTFSSAPSQSLAGWRVRINNLTTVPRIQTHIAAGTVAVLDAAWPEETQTAVSYVAFKLEYNLASDFLRFCGRPILFAGPYRMDVVDRDALEVEWPLARVAAFNTGTTLQAALIDLTTIQLSHYTEDPLRVEYPYIFLPNDLVAGETPILPRHYRRFLAVAAAALICLDKSDSKVDALGIESKAILRAMLREQNHHMTRMSQSFGRIKTRQEEPWSQYAVYRT